MKRLLLFSLSFLTLLLAYNYGFSQTQDIGRIFCQIKKYKLKINPWEKETYRNLDSIIKAIKPEAVKILKKDDNYQEYKKSFPEFSEFEIDSIIDILSKYPFIKCLEYKDFIYEEEKEFYIKYHGTKPPTSSYIPKSIAKMKNLTYLGITVNSSNQFPSEILEMDSLFTLDILSIGNINFSKKISKPINIGVLGLTCYCENGFITQKEFPSFIKDFKSLSYFFSDQVYYEEIDTMGGVSFKENSIEFVFDFSAKHKIDDSYKYILKDVSNDHTYLYNIDNKTDLSFFKRNNKKVDFINLHFNYKKDKKVSKQVSAFLSENNKKLVMLNLDFDKNYKFLNIKSNIDTIERLHTKGNGFAKFSDNTKILSYTLAIDLLENSQKDLKKNIKHLLQQTNINSIHFSISGYYGNTEKKMSEINDTIIFYLNKINTPVNVSISGLNNVEKEKLKTVKNKHITLKIY